MRPRSRTWSSSRAFDTIAPVIELETFIAKQRNKVIAVAAYDFETGKEIYINADETMHPASTIKVHIMMDVFHQAEQGLFSLDDRVPLVNSFTSIADGSTFSLLHQDDAEQTLHPRIGESETIAELTRLMIVRSSNLATNILLEKLGTENVNAFMRELGIEGVAVHRGMEDKEAFRRGMNNKATARGLTQTMRLIAGCKVVSSHASQKMIEIMLGQEFNESIPALLPQSVKVAHKTGWNGDIYHDTGIVFPTSRQPYALSIMTRGFPEDREEEAHSCMAHLSKTIYEQLQ
jgi:beta-lactamase class A